MKLARFGTWRHVPTSTSLVITLPNPPLYFQSWAIPAQAWPRLPSQLLGFLCRQFLCGWKNVRATPQGEAHQMEGGEEGCTGEGDQVATPLQMWKTVDHFEMLAD